MKHLLKYTSETIGDNIQRGIGYIISDYLKKKTSGYNTLSHLSQWNDTNRVCQDNIIIPCLFSLKNLMWDNTDYYTITIDDSYTDSDTGETVEPPIARVFGQYVVGGFENVLFPKYDPQQDNFITDILGSCIASLFKENFQDSYAYLRLGQLLLSFAKEQADVIVQTDGNKRDFVPTLFKL